MIKLNKFFHIDNKKTKKKKIKKKKINYSLHDLNLTHLNTSSKLDKLLEQV